jgi:hypothetical protein
VNPGGVWIQRFLATSQFIVLLWILKKDFGGALRSIIEEG